MSFTCLGDELDRLCPFASLCNRTSWPRPTPPTYHRGSGRPPSCTPVTQFRNAASVQHHENLSTCLVPVPRPPPHILSQWHFDKDKSLLVLKGICIYKSGERILTWDLGDREWSRLHHRHAEWFLASCRTFLDRNFLTEKITMLDMGHRSKVC